MPGKVNKRGFKKLPNSEEVAVLVDEGSGSEIELLDMTDLKGHGNAGLSDIRDGAGNSCCSWFVPLYMVLLTFLLVLLTVFQLYVAYNVQLLRSDVSDITMQVTQLADDLASLQLNVQQMNKSHSEELVVTTSILQGEVDGISADMQELEGKVLALENIQEQQVVTQVQRLNKSLSAVYSFAEEVVEIHQSMAELASTVESLDQQMKQVKQSSGTTAGTVEQMSGVVQNVQDTLIVLQGRVTAHEQQLLSELTEIHYQLGNMTLEMESLDWLSGVSLSSLIDMITTNFSNLSVHRPSEAWLAELADLEEKVDDTQIQTYSLTTNVTVIQKSVASLESNLSFIAQHIHKLVPANGKEPLEGENDVVLVGNNVSEQAKTHSQNGTDSNDTQSNTPSAEESQAKMNNSGSSLKGKQGEKTTSTDSQLSKEYSGTTNSPGSSEQSKGKQGVDEENIDRTTEATLPATSDQHKANATPPIFTSNSSLANASDSSVGFANSSTVSNSNTVSNSSTVSSSSTVSNSSIVSNSSSDPGFSTNDTDKPTRPVQRPTSLPSGTESVAVVTHPSDTDSEQDADSNGRAVKFVADLLSAFVALDRNGDGVLSLDEFSSFVEGDEEVFPMLDIDHNGELSKNELWTTSDRLQQLGEQNGGVDQSWPGDEQKPGEVDVDNTLKNENSTDEDDSFNWLDYV